MKYRKLDINGDYTFGQGLGNFHKDTPEAVGQAVKTRLLLFEGEWFLDNSKGTPYSTQILGAGMVRSYDRAIQQVILTTLGVRRIVDYASNYNSSKRSVEITCKLDTVYGRTEITQIL